MTERMENALNHIKTSVDVDPWAMEEVERVFKVLEDIKAEIDQKQYDFMSDKDYDEGVRFGLMLAYQIIDCKLHREPETCGEEDEE